MSLEGGAVLLGVTDSVRLEPILGLAYLRCALHSVSLPGGMKQRCDYPAGYCLAFYVFHAVPWISIFFPLTNFWWSKHSNHTRKMAKLRRSRKSNHIGL